MISTLEPVHCDPAHCDAAPHGSVPLGSAPRGFALLVSGRAPSRAARICRAHSHSILLLVVLLGVVGCRHNIVRSPLPVGVLATVPIEPAPPDANPPMIAELPTPELGPLEGPEPAQPPVRRRPAPPPKETTPPPAQVASNDNTAMLALGALTVGGQDAPQTQQQAEDLIAAVLKRIAALPARLAGEQKADIREIRHLLDQAQQAIKSGNSEGANTLATKAKLLMDDVEKK